MSLGTPDGVGKLGRIMGVPVGIPRRSSVRAQRGKSLKRIWKFCYELTYRTPNVATLFRAKKFET